MNDMQQGIIPGMELPNGKCEPSYPQKFVYSSISPNHHGKSNEAAKRQDSARIMNDVLGR